MTTLLLVLFSALAGAGIATVYFRGLALEHLALRQQLAVFQRATPRPKLTPLDRAFWVALSRTWWRWKDVLAIVEPETVIRWHRRGFARFWAWKSKRVGRPPLAAEVVALIVRMTRENPTWSRRRVASELARLGHDVDKDTVAKYMPRPSARPPRPPSQTWRTFLRNHLVGTIAIDFLTVPTVAFGSTSPITTRTGHTCRSTATRLRPLSCRRSVSLTCVRRPRCSGMLSAIGLAPTDAPFMT